MTGPAPSAGVAGGPTALAIDDEPAMRQLLHRWLEPEVCRVIEAADGVDALRLIQQDDPHIDLVLTDLDMPGLDGCDVIEVLEKYRPDLPVLVVSGSVDLDYAGNHRPFLAKPFTVEQVRAAIGAVIAQVRALREGGCELRAKAAVTRDRTARMRKENTEMIAPVDLVTAAWEIHRRREQCE